MSHEHHHHGAAGATESTLVELLDLDAEVLPGYLSEVTALIRDHAGDAPVHRILDMGSGTGTGTLALAERFPDAEITAVDLSAAMLEHLRAAARDRGVADRIHTVEADLDEGWPGLGDVDLVWASNSLHHTADPDRVLRDVFGALRPGGLLALAELNGLPRFLSGTLGEVEERLHNALAAETAEHVPHLGSDWATLLTAAGFEIRAERHVSIALAAPLPAATGRYAHTTLLRLRAGSTGHLPPDDLTTLDALLADGPEGLAVHPGLTVRDERPVWIAHRP